MTKTSTGSGAGDEASGSEVRTRAELELGLAEQTAFLRVSGEAYDGGLDAEAKRIAVAIRVLVRNTSRSAALLHQLGALDSWLFLDTAGDVDESNLAVETRLVGMQTGGGTNRLRYVPLHAIRSGNEVEGKWLPFERWWSMPVMRDSTKTDFTRADFVLALANREGGAHWDPRAERRIARIMRSESLGFMVWYSHERTGPMHNNPLLPSVRQIGWEMEQTIQEHTDL